jgi:hypothetical protein
MKKILLSYLLLVSLLFSACDEDFFTTTIEVDPPQHTPRLVVHAFNTDFLTIVAQVSRSTTVGEFGVFGVERYIYDAEARIYKNGNFLANMNLVASPDNLNEFNYSVQLPGAITPNDTYTIEVKHPDYPTVTAHSVMEPATEIISSDYLMDGGLDDTGSERSAVDIRFKDPENIVNYYEASITEGGNSITYTSSLDPSTSRSFNENSVIISDVSFDGEEKILRLQIGRNENPDRRIELVWRTITEIQYQYSKSMRQTFDLGDNPFASPVQIPSNIEGGFGFFGLMEIQRIIVQ